MVLSKTIFYLLQHGCSRILLVRFVLVLQVRAPWSALGRGALS